MQPHAPRLSLSTVYLEMKVAPQRHRQRTIEGVDDLRCLFTSKLLVSYRHSCNISID